MTTSVLIPKIKEPTAGPLRFDASSAMPTGRPAIVVSSAGVDLSAQEPTDPVVHPGGGAPFGLLSVEYPIAANGDYHSDGSDTVPPQPASFVTVLLWCYPFDSASGLRKTIAWQHNGTSNGWILETISGVLRLFIDSGGTIAAVSTLTLTDNEWQLVGFRYATQSLTWFHGLYDASGGSSLTVEGPSNPGNDAVSYTSQSHFTLGGTSASINGFHGRQCEFGLRNNTLADSDAEALYNGGRGLGFLDFTAELLDDLVCHYVMDEASGTLFDRHTGGYHIARVDNAGTDVIYAQPGPAA